MPAYVVIGGQWGDEGKGKIVDYLAANIQVVDLRLRNQKSRKPVAADIIARFNGGNNAGHTVWTPDGEFRLHLVPCGMPNPQVKLNVITSGVAVNTFSLDNESKTNPGEFQVLQNLCGVTIENFLDRLAISKKCPVVMPWHIAQDVADEILRGNTQLSTTQRGMGPVFSDHVARVGLRIGDLCDSETLAKKLLALWNRKVALFDKFYFPLIEERAKILFPEDTEKMCGAAKQKVVDAFSAYGQYKDLKERLLIFGEKFQKCFANTERLLYDANERGENILLEGAQGFGLDNYHGTYPYVTSSLCGIAAAYNCGITKFEEIIGVLKAYCTRVGNGPFPTEMSEQEAAFIREIAYEYGTTTGRARRIGWFDFIAAQYFVRMNGVTCLALTRLDILDHIKPIKVGVGYDCAHEKLGRGKKMPCVQDIYCDEFDHINENGDVRAVLEERPSWGPMPKNSRGIRGRRRFEDLPQSAQEYCMEIQKKVAPLLLVSTGPKRKETIVMSSH